MYQNEKKKTEMRLSLDLVHSWDKLENEKNCHDGWPPNDVLVTSLPDMNKNQKCWILGFTNFHGRDIPVKANLKLSAWCHQMRSWERGAHMALPSQERAGANTPLSQIVINLKNQVY